MKLSTLCLTAAIILMIMALCMPWCYGYMMEAKRIDMADSARAFGWLTGSLSFILFFLFPLFRMEEK